MKFTAFISLLMIASLPLMGMDAPSLRKKKVSKKHVKTPSEADVLCRRLLETTRAIESLLQSVSDAASADAAAPQLQSLLQQMRKLLAGLEQLPFDAETTQTITKYMTDLTYITQGYMPLVQELIAQNAYGSEQLMVQLLSHHSENDYSDTADNLGADDLPQSVHQRLHNTLSTSLYALCKAVDTATAKDAAETLRECIATYRELQQEAQLLAAQTPEAAPPADVAEQTDFLRRAHEQEQQRLEKEAYYQDPDLQRLLQEILSLMN